jgi:hypothetical protein
MRPARLPRGFSSLYVACVYIEPKSAVSQNAIKNDEKPTNAIATLIQQAIDNDLTPQCPLLFVCGDFNTAKCNNFFRLLGVKLLNCAPMRGKGLLDRIYTNAPAGYSIKMIPARTMDTDHDIVVATPINHLINHQSLEHK